MCLEQMCCEIRQKEWHWVITKNPNQPRAWATAVSSGCPTTSRHHSVNRLEGKLSAAEEFIVAMGVERCGGGFLKKVRPDENQRRRRAAAAAAGGGGGGGGGGRRRRRRAAAAAAAGGGGGGGRTVRWSSAVTGTPLDAAKRLGDILLHLFGSKCSDVFR
jgi:hypothetical protein